MDKRDIDKLVPDLPPLEDDLDEPAPEEIAKSVTAAGPTSGPGAGEALPTAPSEASSFEDTVGAQAVTNVPDSILGRLAQGAVVQIDPSAREAGRRRILVSDAPGEGGSRRPGRAILATLIVCALVLGVAAFATYGAELWGGRSVPHVSGKPLDAAVAALEERGFSVSVEERLVDDAAGLSIETSPATGTRVEPGSKVVLYMGAQRTIPALAGLTLDEARAELERQGATNIEVAYVSSDAPEGTVTAVSPEEGAAFASGDLVTVSVAQPYTVPYIMGKNVDEAVRAIEAAGLTTKVSYVNAAVPAGIVVLCTPGQGERIGAGDAVELSVSAPQPTNYRHLMEYVGADVRGVSGMLAANGFAVESAVMLEDGNLYARYTSPLSGTITFTGEPYTSHYYNDSGDTTDFLAQGKHFSGVRLALPASQVPTSASKLSDAALQEAMALLGFTDMLEVVTDATIQLPADTPRLATPFVYALGQMGENCWTILMYVSSDGPHLEASAGPVGIYTVYDTSLFGGSLCSTLAYIEMYTG